MTRRDQILVVGAGAAVTAGLAWWWFRVRPLSLSMTSAPSGAVVDTAALASIAQDSRIPWHVRQYAMEAVQAAQVSAPSSLGVETWARLLLADADRESSGNALAVGDGGNAHGLMQVNDRFWPAFAALADAQKFDPLTNLTYGGKILRQAFDAFAPLGTAFALQAAIAAFNRGVAGVQSEIARGLSVDAETAGANYSSDVLRRFADAGGVLPSGGLVA